jgi:hypothetical protein
VLNNYLVFSRPLRSVDDFWEGIVMAIVESLPETLADNLCTLEVLTTSRWHGGLLCMNLRIVGLIAHTSKI